MNASPLTHPAAGDRPDTPWAVHLTDLSGAFRLLCFDLDASDTRTNPSRGSDGRRAALAALLGLPPQATADLLDGPAGHLMTLTLRHFRPRTDPIPTFTDDRLTGLRMPVSIILGASDRMLDAKGSAARARRLVGESAVDLVPQAGHLLPDQTLRISKALNTFR